MSSTVARPEEMESSDEEFVDAFEYLPEESNPSTSASDPAENSSQDSPTVSETASDAAAVAALASPGCCPGDEAESRNEETQEKTTKWRKVRKVVKRSFQTVSNRVCALVKRESAAATDPLETEAARDDAQPSPSASVCFITLEEYIEMKGSSMKEKDARIIMRRLFETLKTSWDLGVYPPIYVHEITIDPNTLQINIIDPNTRAPRQPLKNMTEFQQALLEAWFDRWEKLKYAESYFNVMYALVDNIKRPFWKRRVSFECSFLLWRLAIQRRSELETTLQDVLNDPWFSR
ncbi:uncharacterized protein [Pseudorasbora parva]|uniref:uncharacterized protein isoform X1 n=1 Tax=Pseudorasbora parva TaxID=51549 RepID=UPI00351F3258